VNWDSLADFIDMGGDALYVWGCYVMVIAALGWEAVMLVQRRERALEDLHALADVAPDAGPDDGG
jgi:heme exporter protein CcmD